MKFIHVKCPTCGGKLTMEDSESQLYTCQFCHNQFMIDKENIQNITNNYTIYPDPASSFHHNGYVKGENGFKIAGGLFILLFVVFTFMILSDGSGQSTRRVNSSGYRPTYGAVSGSSQESAGKTADDSLPETELYRYFVSEIFQKPFSSITEEDLLKVKYFTMSHGRNSGYEVRYSFDDIYTADSSQIETLALEDGDWNKKDIYHFKGLTKLDLNYYLIEDIDLSKFPSLKSITCHELDFVQLADLGADPLVLKEVNIKSIPSLDGILKFKELESLILEGVESCDLKALTALKNLKSLTIRDSTVTDYNPISAITSLEAIDFDLENLKDIGFVTSLPSLTSLSLKDSAIYTLAPLAGNTTLSSLVLENNFQLEDFSAVGTLTGLTDLLIDKGTAQTDPDLSPLTQLTKLDISGFMDVSSLRALTNLKELSVHGCNIDNVDVLSALTNVERLTFYSVWTSKSQPSNLNFLSGMTGLKYADFSGKRNNDEAFNYFYMIKVYGDISAVFNHPSLEEIYLDNGQFEINFDKINENPTLRILSLKNLTLHKNYYQEFYNGGLSSLWYDDVKLAEHLGFLTKFPNLEELYLDRNSIPDISFASSMPKLTKLSLRDNYVTDLTPLSHAENLTYLNVAENPISTTDNMENGITIIK